MTNNNHRRPVHRSPLAGKVIVVHHAAHHKAANKQLVIAGISIVTLIVLTLLLLFTDQFVGKAIMYDEEGIVIAEGEAGLTLPYLTLETPAVTTTIVNEGVTGYVDFYIRVPDDQTSLLGQAEFIYNTDYLEAPAAESFDLNPDAGLVLVGDPVISENTITITFRAATPSAGNEIAGTVKVGTLHFTVLPHDDTVNVANIIQTTNVNVLARDGSNLMDPALYQSTTFEVRNNDIADVCTDADGDGYCREEGGVLPVGKHGWNDCDDDNPAIKPSAVETCNDEIDNNCNLLVDCADNSCAGATLLGGTLRCLAGVKEEYNCFDGVDNDGDQLIDCADLEYCSGASACCAADNLGACDQAACEALDDHTWNADGEGACEADAVAECDGNALEVGEECDGEQLGGATCASEGFDGGTLACIAAEEENECTFDTTGCCDNDCEAGATQCAGNDVQTCELADNGCMEWGAAEACDNGDCVDNACPDAAAVCTGNNPDVNAALCNNDDQELQQDTPKTLVAACTDIKCEFICNAEFSLEGDVCVENPECDADEDCVEANNICQESVCVLDTDGDTIADADDTCPNDPDNDEDEDSVCGDVDNCPLIANPSQEDFDNDNTGDACDTESVGTNAVITEGGRDVNNNVFTTEISPDNDGFAGRDVTLYTILYDGNGEVLVVKSERIPDGGLAAGKTYTSTVNYPQANLVKQKSIIILDVPPDQGQTLNAILQAHYD